MKNNFVHAHATAYKNIKAMTAEGLKQQQIESIVNTAYLLIISCKADMMKLLKNNDSEGVRELFKMKEQVYKLYAHEIGNIHLAPLFVIKLLEVLPMSFYYYDNVVDNIDVWEEIFSIAKNTKVLPEQTYAFQNYLKMRLEEQRKEIPVEIKEYIDTEK